MCGIYGTTQALRPDLAQDILGLLRHRGPDSNGLQEIQTPEGPLLLLHTRLAIQDLSAAGHQPMADHQGRWWITYNGELYNHWELRKELAFDAFRGSSDTETLVEYLAQYGIERTLSRLNGIFGFGAYDSRTGLLYLARDHFGIKPVYYAAAAGALVFASEIKPVLRTLERRAQLNARALDQFLTYRYTPSPYTLVEGVQRLPAGHYLRWDTATRVTELRRYVEPQRRRFEGSLQDAVHAYRERLKQTVGAQLISDVPVGVLLSGGIDSAVVAAMAREHNDRLTAFTVGFGEGHPECEIEDARETAAILGIRHEATIVTPDKLLDAFGHIVRSVEEPLGTTSILPMWYLSEAARREVTVVLTGQGNDEPWGGYRRYQIELLLQRAPVFKWPWCRIPESLSDLVADEGLRRGLQCLGRRDTIARFEQAYALFTEGQKAQIAPDSVDGERDRIGYWLDWLRDVPDLTDAERMMRIDTRMNLSDDLLLYGDKVSMAFALEARVPMLDPELVNFIESLPLAYRSTLRQTKIVHRLMARDYLPAAVVNRPKKGFYVPFGAWSRGIWREYIEANLLDPKLAIYEALRHQGVRDLWQRHLAGRDYSKQIFALLMLSVWHSSLSA